MIIIFYDNCASFKKSKLTYKLILSKCKKTGFDIESCFLVSAEIYSQWLVEITLTSCGVELGLTGLTSTSRNVRRTFHVLSVVSVQCFSPERSPSYPDFNAQPSLEQFPILSSLMGSMLASCPFLRIVFLGFHCP